MPNIFAPLPNIPMHVMNTKIIGRKAINSSGFFPKDCQIILMMGDNAIGSKCNSFSSILLQDMWMLFVPLMNFFDFRQQHIFVLNIKS
jgi:hypothetical protein